MCSSYVFHLPSNRVTRTRFGISKRTPAPPRAKRLLIQPAAIQGIQHVAICAGAAVRIARIEHVAHIQPRARCAAGRRGRGRGDSSLGRLHRRIRGVGGCRMTTVVVSRLRRGASIMRRGVVGRRGGVRLISWGGAGRRDGSEIGRVRVLVA